MATAQKAIWFQTSKEQLDAVLLEVVRNCNLCRRATAWQSSGTVL